MTTFDRRRLLAAAGAAALVGAAGCAPRTPADAVTWSMWSSSPAEAEVWAEFGQFVERSLGLRSLAQLTPSGGYPTRLDLQLVSGTQAMVTAINGTLIPTYASRGALRPLDDLIDADADFDLDDFYPDIRRIGGFDGRTYGIGFDVAPTVLYYNATMFAERGVPVPDPRVPMTWDAFAELARGFAEEPGRYGFTCAPSIDDIVSWLYCAGGNVMNDEQSASTLHTPESTAALDFLVGLFTRDAVTPPITNLVTESALANFLDGNVAMMQNGPWQVLNVRKADFEWDVVPFPAGAVGSTPRVSGSVFAIPAATADVDLAWRLLTTLTSTDALDIYAQAGRNNPARRSASTAFAPPPPNLGIVVDILTGELAGGHAYDVTTNWNEVRQLLGQDLPRTFLGQLSVADAVALVRPGLDVLMTQNLDNIRQLQADR